MTYRTVVLAVAMSLCCVVALGAPTSVSTSLSVPTRVADTDESDRIDITVRDGMLLVTVNKTTTIKIFSILGQLVTQRTLSPGITRIKLPARGIYILKAGDITRRITI